MDSFYHNAALTLGNVKLFLCLRSSLKNLLVCQILQFNPVFEYLSDDLKKAAKAARKYKGKKVKPEKPKKKNVSKASTLND